MRSKKLAHSSLTFRYNRYIMLGTFATFEGVDVDVIYLDGFEEIG